MNENQTNEVLNLSKNGLSSRAIAKKLGISKSKAHNIIRDNRINGQQQNTSIISNGQQQNTSTMPKGQEQNTSIMPTIEHNYLSILEKLPKKTAFLVENLIIPSHVEASLQERQGDIKGCISLVRHHLEVKRIYKEFTETMDYLYHTALLSFDEVDEYILKLKAISRDTEKQLSELMTGEKHDLFRLPSIYSNSLIKYMYSMKMACKTNGDDLCEIQDNMKAVIEKWLSLSIAQLFPNGYERDIAEIEANFDMLE